VCALTVRNSLGHPHSRCSGIIRYNVENPRLKGINNSQSFATYGTSIQIDIVFSSQWERVSVLSADCTTLSHDMLQGQESQSLYRSKVSIEGS
jgi:hypothetical protein